MLYKGDASLHRVLAGLFAARTALALDGENGMPQLFGGGFTFERPADYASGPADDRTTPPPFQHVYDDGSGELGNCGMMNGVNRIAGGWEEDIERHPWTVFVQSCNAAEFCAGCAGSIIAPSYALTAAHCTRGAQITTATIRSGVIFGLSDIESFTATNWRDVTAYYYHQDFDWDTHRSDIGALKTDLPFVLGGDPNENFEFNGNWGTNVQFVFPICLPVPQFCLQPYTSLMTTGWGYQSAKDSHYGENWNLAVGMNTQHEHNPNKPNGPSWDGPSTHLRGVWLPLVQLAKCRLYHDHRDINPALDDSSWKNFKIDNNMTCAGAQLKSGVCHGDQGGPLVYHDKNKIATLYGATSWGLGCARAGSPGVFSRITSFLSWIKWRTGAYMDDTPPMYGDGDFLDTCRDYKNNLKHTTPRDPDTASLVTFQGLIKSWHFFDNFCVRVKGALNAIDNDDATKNTYPLVLRDPNDCNPDYQETQWVWMDPWIKSVAFGNAYCWHVKWAITNKKRRNEVKLKECDMSNPQKFAWNPETGKLYAMGRPDLIVRFKANEAPQLVEKKHIPVAYQLSKPTMMNSYLISGINYLENICAVKKGNRHFRKRQPIWALKAMVNKKGSTGKACTDITNANYDVRAMWYWDEVTMQIKNWHAPNQDSPKHGRWCWAGNPRSKKRNYIRLRRCSDPKETCDDEDCGRRQYWTQFDWDPNTSGLYIARNPNLVVRFERNKRVAIINKWKVGFNYAVGNAIPTCVPGMDAHNNDCDPSTGNVEAQGENPFGR